MPRPIYVIAQEIRADWTEPYYGAVPYIAAMYQLNSVNDCYGVESATSIIQYFLVNAKTWRGETARRIKSELKEMTK